MIPLLQFTQQIQEEVTLFLVSYGLKALGALIVLIVGWTAASWASRKSRRLAEKRERIDRTLVPIIGHSVRIALLVVTLIMVLQQFGVEATSLVALVGAAGLAIGLALQGSLSDVAAGVMLLTFRPFEVGDVADLNGQIGIVDEINLMVTKFHTPDNVFMVIPNGGIWGSPIKNYTRNPTRRIDLVFGIAYDDDVERAMQIIQEAVQADPRVLKDPQPTVVVGELADSSVNLWSRPWVKSSDYWAVRWEMTQKIKQLFDARGITIPFPQRDVHLFQTTPPLEKDLA